MSEPFFVRKSVADQVRRLRRQADTCDELPLHRLAERGEPPSELEGAAELPDAETVIIDAALYHAASERTTRARALVRRERLGLGGLAVAASRVVVAARS